ncbi:DmsC/YnfH family molybdoenzyme membrane anchor subunit [Gimesia panareensis]|uniref:DmsC/YnfH family molybdoenzyme membrane anchor subunit n=1 Tax=Gimesia panareensis TaxID=2527978 RepID=UPI00118BA24A|nr:DmsC/YnfH family molybdoenzyme membrane anchor subunit [Gimesia panareensis]QDU50535.1 Anaerobic dimethyl sulfoxide reductase chain B [Gimesia panareensis]
MSFNYDEQNSSADSPLDEHTSGSQGTATCPQEFDLINLLLEEQQTLTAVDEFARQYESQALPAQSRYYADLIPSRSPQSGEQFAFQVDLDRCSGCKACVTACHSLNGLDENETWRDVGLLIGGTSQEPIYQHVTTACHHCLDPGCMQACPVNAYEKDPITGIVKHLDDQCFGCQYCTLACPYDVPKYHSKKGIVRKCDMCSQRLTDGEAPACVQACPHQAISIDIVNKEQVLADSEVNAFLPAAPDPQHTYPTTTYKSRKPFPRNTIPADYYSASPQHAHLPLVIMLVLTQLSVGAFLTGSILEYFLSTETTSVMTRLSATTAMLFGLLALGASTLHLGRPLYAFRGILGLRHSWLSREILAFGVFAGAAQTYAALTWIAGSMFPNWQQWQPLAGWMVSLLGVVGIFCSIMIYVFTKREFWSFDTTATKFALTAALLGIASTWVVIFLLNLTVDSAATNLLLAQAGPILSKALIVTSVIKLSFEASIFRYLLRRQNSPLKRSALLMSGELSSVTLARFACGILGGILMPLFLLNHQTQPVQNLILFLIIGILFIACLAGELLERYLFFSAVAAPRMPGVIH